MTTARQQMLVMSICAVAAAIFVFGVVPAAIVEPNNVPGIALSPRFLPSILGMLVLVLSLIGLLKAILAPKTASAIDPDGGALSSASHAAPGMLLPAVALAVLIGTLLIIPFAGMRWALVAGAVILLLLGGERRLWVLALVGVALPVAATWLFQTAFHVPVPVSLWLG